MTTSTRGYPRGRRRHAEAHVLNTRRVSAEELHGDCLRRARVLERSSRRQRDVGDAVGAVLYAWAGDVAAAQAVMLDHMVMRQRGPQRLYFAAGQQLAAGLADVESADAAAFVGALREQLFAAFDADTATEIAGQLPDANFLVGLPAPSAADFDALAERRLQGLAPREFVSRRRREAAEAMVSAHAHHLRGDDAAAIATAYDSDFRSLEAYCIESAAAIGDEQLLSVEVRWELVVQAMAEVAGLPEEFASAVAVVRAAMSRALGEPDASRLVASMPTVSTTERS